MITSCVIALCSSAVLSGSQANIVAALRLKSSQASTVGASVKQAESRRFGVSVVPFQAKKNGDPLELQNSSNPKPTFGKGRHVRYTFTFLNTERNKRFSEIRRINEQMLLECPSLMTRPPPLPKRVFQTCNSRLNNELPRTDNVSILERAEKLRDWLEYVLSELSNTKIDAQSSGNQNFVSLAPAVQRQKLRELFEDFFEIELDGEDFSVNDFAVLDHQMLGQAGADVGPPACAGPGDRLRYGIYNIMRKLPGALRGEKQRSRQFALARERHIRVLQEHGFRPHVENEGEAKQQHEELSAYGMEEPSQEEDEQRVPHPIAQKRAAAEIMTAQAYDASVPSAVFSIFADFFKNKDRTQHN